MKVDLDSLRTPEIAQFCRRNQIRRLSLFGSVLRDEGDENSDVDLLVQFEPGARISLLSMVRMENALTEMIGQKVDLRTPGDLSRYFRDEVVGASRTLYAA